MYYANAKTSVFWDVEDFPNPVGRSFYEIIKSALENEGYRGEVSIIAYGEKKPDDLDSVIAFVPKRGKLARLNKMLVDIAIWTLDNPLPNTYPANLMVVAKNIPEENEFVGHLDLLRDMDYNLLLVVANDCAPEEASLPYVFTLWFWESLLDGAKPLGKTQLQSLLDRSKFVGFREGPEEEIDLDAPCPFCGK